MVPPLSEGPEGQSVHKQNLTGLLDLHVDDNKSRNLLFAIEIQIISNKLIS